MLLVAMLTLAGCGSGGGSDTPPGPLPLSTVKDITSFSINGHSASIINTNIALTLPNGTSLNPLVATFNTTGQSVKIGNVTQVSGTTPNNFTSTLTYTVTAADSSIKNYLVTVAAASGSSQTPVNLTAIDGETRTDGTLTYYTRNNITLAVNPPAEFVAAGAKSWDDPSWFPIGVWLAAVMEQADADRWKDLGLNFANANHSYTRESLMRSNGFWTLINHDYKGAGSWETNYDPSEIGYECVGIMINDEPNSMAEVYAAMAKVPAADKAGRFWYQNFTRYAVLRDLAGATPAEIMAPLDTFSADEYYGADLSTSATAAFGGVGRLYNIDRITIYPTETRRACHYGSFVGLASNNGGHNKIVWSFVENGGPQSEDTVAGYYQMPELMVAAGWHSVINGARALLYFNHSFAGPVISHDNFSHPYFKEIHNVYPAPSSISIYDAAKTLNARLQILAPVIFSPFDGIRTVQRTVNGFLANITPAPTPFTGVDAMCKWRASEGKHYIFAASRGYMTDPQASATFTLANNYSGTATVLFESRTIPIVNGSFTDTFANGNAWHIYRIDGIPAG